MSITEKVIISHYKNLVYEDMEGEIWKDLPNLDGNFLISNFGRVKSLDRTIYCKNETTRFCKGRIYKAVAIKYKNKTIGDYTLELKVGLFYQSEYHSIRIARTVYNLFVQQLNFEREKLMVAHKDGNRLNNQVSNLYLQTIAQKQKKIITTNRAFKLSQFQTKEGHKKGAIARHKPVTQFSLQGYPIKSYNSIKEAAMQTGVDGSGIVAAIKKIKMVSAGGYLWQYGIVKNKIDTTFYTNFLKNSKLVQGVAVAQLSNDLSIFNYFKSITEASKKTGLHPNKISSAIKQNQLIENCSWHLCNGIASW